MITHRDRFLEIVRKLPDSKEADNLAARFDVVAFQCEDSGEVQSYDKSIELTRYAGERFQLRNKPKSCDSGYERKLAVAEVATLQ